MNAAFRDAAGLPELVVIGPGRFTMGTSAADVERLGIAPTNRTLPWQQPAHAVTVGAFALGVTPVTRAEYRAFADDAGEQVAGSGWRDPGIRQADDHPVVRVTWRHAQRYAAWLAGRTGRGYRLPGEAEWGYAARAGSTTAWWWGDDAGVGRTVCDDCGSDWDGKGTAPVRSFEPNPFGLHDVLGQVYEWTADDWHPSYAGAPVDGSVWLGGDPGHHPIRGGSWNLDARYARVANRGRDATDYDGTMLGFRVARDL